MKDILKRIQNGLYYLYLLALLFAFNVPRVSLCVVLSIFIHECGHRIALWVFKKPFLGISLNTRGARMGYGGVLSYREECIVCLCGPLANFLLGLLSLALAHGSRDFSLLFMGVNFFYAITNLLPLPSYDGERILRILLSSAIGASAGERVIYCIGFFLRTLMLFLSLYLIFYFDVAYQIFGVIFFSFLGDFTQ